MSDTPHAEGHTGPIKNPKQLLLAVFFSFVVPIFAIIGLVTYVVADKQPAIGAADAQAQLAQRIARVGSSEVRDANRPLKAGAEVYTAQCAACHAAGAAGAPKFGDASAWAPRIKQGFEALVTASLRGKGQMPPQGGGDFDDTEIARAVAHLANAGGANFPEPQRPAAAPAVAADAPAAPMVAAAAPAAPAAAAPAAAPATAAPAPAMAANANGEALYKSVCFACHAASVAGSPKLGDKAAWAPRIATGIDALTASVIKGKGAMPAKGGSSASDADIKAAVVYMVNASK